MIELIVKMLGCGKLLTAIDALDGYKTYIAGTCKMLTGAAAILGALTSFLPHLATGHGLSGVIAVLTGPDFPVAKAAISGGWLVMLMGLSDIAKAHASEKLSAQVQAVPLAVADSQPQILPAH